MVVTLHVSNIDKPLVDRFIFFFERVVSHFYAHFSLLDTFVASLLPYPCRETTINHRVLYPLFFSLLCFRCLSAISFLPTSRFRRWQKKSELILGISAINHIKAFMFICRTSFNLFSNSSYNVAPSLKIFPLISISLTSPTILSRLS